jgi:hypothetical protein
MSNLATGEAGIASVKIFSHRVGNHILDLVFSLGIAMLPSGLELKSGLLPGSDLLRDLDFILRLKLAFTIFICNLVLMSKLTLPFSNECLIYQSMKIRKVQHVESASKETIESSEKSVDLPFFRGHIMNRIASQMIKLV